MGSFQKIKFRPGINREDTAFANEGGWRACDKIRFHMGFPETIGGWSKYLDSTFLGTCRNLFSWVTLEGAIYVGVGTSSKYYVSDGGVYQDITPIRNTTAAGDVTFSATNGSSTLTVSDTSHGAIEGDYVTFSGAVSLGGNVVADELNKEFQIATVSDANTYSVELSVTANASDTGNGGASVVGEYQITIGKTDAVAGVGFGTGAFGKGVFGEGTASNSNTLIPVRTWSSCNFGEDLVINPSGGGVYYWEEDSGFTTRAVALPDLSGAADAPTVSNLVTVSEQDRHIICFGCDPFDNVGVQDPMLVRWSDQENAADWQVRTTNTAGSKRLQAGSAIIGVTRTRREILIFTDAALYSMQFLGPPYTFGFEEISRNIRPAGPNSIISIDDVVYWMDDGRFMMYDGSVREVQCTLRRHVFENMNRNEEVKVVAGSNTKNSEVWWHYPTGTENDSYVVYNYLDNVWYYGTMARTAWADIKHLKYPIAAGTDNYLYFHEFGANDGSTSPASGINAYIESSATDIAEGDNYVFIDKILPDLTFRNSSSGSPTVTMTLKMRDFPGEDFAQTDQKDVIRTSSDPEEYTKELDVRVRGREFVFRIESDGENTQWRLGIPRIEIRKDGQKV